MRAKRGRCYNLQIKVISLEGLRRLRFQFLLEERPRETEREREREKEREREEKMNKNVSTWSRRTCTSKSPPPDVSFSLYSTLLFYTLSLSPFLQFSILDSRSVPNLYCCKGARRADSQLNIYFIPYASLSLFYFLFQFYFLFLHFISFYFICQRSGGTYCFELIRFGLCCCCCSRDGWPFAFTTPSNNTLLLLMMQCMQLQLQFAALHGGINIANYFSCQC